MLLSTGKGTVIEKMNEMERRLDDSKTQIDLRLEEKLNRKVNEVEDSCKKQLTRDYQRLNEEMLNLNKSHQNLCNEQKAMEEKIKAKLFTTKSVQKQLTEMGGRVQADEILKDSQIQFKIESSVGQKLRSLGLQTEDMAQFRDSIQRLMYENNPTALISSSNKEIQQQTLEMVQKLSKDLYFEIDQIDQQI